MNFRLSLQKILDYRLREVDEAQKYVNYTKNAILHLKNILEQERENYFADRDALNESVKKVEFTEINIYEKSLAISQSKMMDLLNNIREMQNDLKIQEENLIKAKLNKKIIEKLYVLRENEFNKKENIRNQHDLDELATLKFRKSLIEENSVEELDE
jgi:flagellar export protein FliJ